MFVSWGCEKGGIMRCDDGLFALGIFGMVLRFVAVEMVGLGLWGL